VSILKGAESIFPIQPFQQELKYAVLLSSDLGGLPVKDILFVPVAIKL
jgi:hypothetical protein